METDLIMDELQWNLDFSNPRFLKNSEIFLEPKVVSLGFSFTVILPPRFRTPDFSKQFSFPFGRFEKSVSNIFSCYFFFLPFLSPFPTPARASMIFPPKVSVRRGAGHDTLIKQQKICMYASQMSCFVYSQAFI